MNLKISKTSSQPRSVARDLSAAAEILSFATCKSTFGRVLLARSAKGVCAILIGTNQVELGVELGADLAARLPKANLIADEASVHDELAKVIRFVDNPAEGLHLPLDMRGTPFQHRVWEKLRAIPVGRTVTYTDVANWVGPLTSARAVAGACASNSIALAVPCHRVVRSNGDLGGYRWGIERKREMIRREEMA